MGWSILYLLSFKHHWPLAMIQINCVVASTAPTVWLLNSIPFRFIFLFFCNRCNSFLSFGGPQLYNLEALPFTYDQYVVIELAGKLNNSVFVWVHEFSSRQTTLQLFQIAGARDRTTDPWIVRPDIYPTPRGTHFSNTYKHNLKVTILSKNENEWQKNWASSNSISQDF